MQKLIYENHEVMLCKGKGCCPRLRKLNKEQVLITDDDNNKIVLSIEQALLITEAISLVEND